MPGINQALERVWARNDSEVIYTGRWTFPDAIGTIGTKVGGMGMTLTSTGTGLFTLTLDATPAAILHIDATLVNTTQTVLTLSMTSTGGTFRTAAYAAHATPVHPTAGSILSISVSALKSLVK